MITVTKVHRIISVLSSLFLLLVCLLYLDVGHVVFTFFFVFIYIATTYLLTSNYKINFLKDLFLIFFVSVVF